MYDQTTGCGTVTDHDYHAARVGSDINWWQCTRCGQLKRHEPGELPSLSSLSPVERARALAFIAGWNARHAAVADAEAAAFSRGWREGYLAGTRDAIDKVACG